MVFSYWKNKKVLASIFLVYDLKDLFYESGLQKIIRKMISHAGTNNLVAYSTSRNLFITVNVLSEKTLS